MNPGAAGQVARKFAVGLTGGIGSGKSTVAALFQAHGALVIDSDAISHQLTQADGQAIPAIQQAFGSECIDADGALNRAWMRQLVFSSKSAKEQLESILHPLIRARMQALAGEATSAPYLLLVVPLLFEAPNYRELVQRTLVVDCPEADQIARTMRRNALTEAEVRAIMAQQLPRAERLRRADDVIGNDGTLDDLRERVALLHQTYARLSSEATYLPSGRN
jgi:dephospho-CoA kinase